MADTIDPNIIGMLKRQPANPNFLGAHRFRLVFHRLPHIVYFLQEINLPGITLGAAVQPTPFVQIPVYGDNLTFDDLTISFAVEEDWINYREIQNWMFGLGFPRSFQESASLSKDMYGRTSDIMLAFLDSEYNANRFLMFRGAWPSNLGSLQFSSKTQDTAVQQCSATFRYAYWEWVDDIYIDDQTAAGR